MVLGGASRMGGLGEGWAKGGGEEAGRGQGRRAARTGGGRSVSGVCLREQQRHTLEGVMRFGRGGAGGTRRPPWCAPTRGAPAASARASVWVSQGQGREGWAKKDPPRQPFLPRARATRRDRNPPQRDARRRPAHLSTRRGGDGRRLPPPPGLPPPPTRVHAQPNDPAPRHSQTAATPRHSLPPVRPPVPQAPARGYIRNAKPPPTPPTQLRPSRDCARLRPSPPRPPPAQASTAMVAAGSGDGGGRIRQCRRRRRCCRHHHNRRGGTTGGRHERAAFAPRRRLGWSWVLAFAASRAFRECARKKGRKNTQDCAAQEEAQTRHS